MTSVHHGDLQPVPTRPGMRTRELVGPAHGCHSLFVSELVLAPDAAIPLHTHPQEEAFVVLTGRIFFVLGDDIDVVAAGATLRIPPGLPHAVRNDWPEPARCLVAAAADRATWFTEHTTYLEGVPRE